MKLYAYIVLLLTILTPTLALAADPLAGSLSVGEKAKDFTLPDAFKKQVSLHEQLKDGPVVLSFYRGGWCPICNEQLQAYQERMPDIKSAGGQLIAISPEVPNKGQATAIKNSLNFTVLSDTGNRVARQYGILWEVPANDQEGFATWLRETTGMTLLDYNGQEGYELPVPATFVIDSNGMVVYAFKDVDYRKRADIDDIIAALGKLK